LPKFISLAKDRLKKLSDIPEAISFFFSLPEYDKSLLSWKGASLEDGLSNLREIYSKLELITENDWEKDKLEATILDWIKTEKEGRNGDFLWPLRVSLSGLKNSPSPFEIAWALGKDESLKRISKALLA